MRTMKRHLISVLLVAIVVCAAPLAPAEQSPVTDSHVDRINSIFRENGIRAGSVVLDMYGRLELKGEYADEQEVDKAFSLAQTVVGVRWVSPVTPENIKVKEWERRLGGLFSRARVLKPTSRGDDAPGPIRNRYALVVGVGQFKYGINTLHYAVQDATSFRQFLTDPRRGGFPNANVTFLSDQSATRDNIARALNRIRDIAEADDLVAIYMSSHGTPPDKFGGVHIVTHDTEVKPRERVWQTSVTESMLRDFIENLRAKRLVVILDTCYSNGAYSRVPGFLPPGGKSLGADEDEGYGVSHEYGKRLFGSKDIVVEDKPAKASAKSSDFGQDDGWGKVLISASGSGEKSWESDSLHNSIFTYYFVDGLNRYNGSIKNAFYHSKPLVSKRVKQEKGAEIEQNPQVMATNTSWDMKISQKRSK